MPEKGIALLKPKYVLDSLEDVDEEIFQTSIIDRYIARPNSLDNLTFAEFAMWYTNSTNCPPSDDECQVTQSKNHKRSRITLKNNLGTMSKRLKPAIIRYHRFDEGTEPEDFSHSMLMLYWPWRKQEDLKLDESYTIMYKELFSQISAKKT